MKEFFQPTAMSAESKSLVVTMQRILESYQAQGYDLSLRQLYYQLVSKNIVANTEQSYKRVGSILNDARLCGYIDWEMIVDRGRETLENVHWNSMKEMLEARARSFMYDRWDSQPWHVEVMVEKQALEGVLEPVCRELDIPFTANKGYSSSSAMYETGKRLNQKLTIGKNVCVLYLGDHDPSGIDMSRDVEDRLKLFSGYNFYQPDNSQSVEWQREAIQTMNARRFNKYKDSAYSHLEFTVDRLALNMDQIEEYNPPPNPAKTTDSRSRSYIDLYGEESWELDALEPTVLAALVRDGVDRYIDQDKMDEAHEKEGAARSKLREVAAGLVD
jgi:hypothetical protein